jgi:hypothetical protein
MELVVLLPKRITWMLIPVSRALWVCFLVAYSATGSVSILNIVSNVRMRAEL